VILDGLGECDVVCRENQFHVHSMTPLAEKIQRKKFVAGDLVTRVCQKTVKLSLHENARLLLSAPLLRKKFYGTHL